MEETTESIKTIDQPLYFELAEIEQIIAHRVGNKNNEQDLIPSHNLLRTDERLRGMLHRYFLKPFVQPELFHFTFSNEDFTLNPLYKFASEIFEDSERFAINSVHIARYLYDLTTHPQIKSGDLFVVRFTNVAVNGKSTEAIGLFKSESKQDFLKLETGEESFELYHESGINIDKLDKGALIFNMEAGEGFRVAMVDRVNKAQEAQYWKDDFLQIAPCRDSFHHTKALMECTRDFLMNEAPRETPMNKANQIDLLNRSAGYFKEHEQFSREEFEEEVFQNPDLSGAFRQYAGQNLGDMPEEKDGGFELSPHAVKKYAKGYKSVLKLDKNFHVYIHGDRSLIEQGRDEDGRKYYKIFYEEEH